MPAAALAPFQPHSRDSAQSDCTRLFVRRGTDQLAQPPDWDIELTTRRDGQPIPLYRAQCMARAIANPRRLSASSKRTLYTLAGRAHRRCSHSHPATAADASVNTTYILRAPEKANQASQAAIAQR